MKNTQRTVVFNPRILDALVYDALKGETFASVSDLCEAVKTKAARLGIPYTSTLVGESIERVERARGAAVVGMPPIPSWARPIEHPPAISQADATRILNGLTGAIKRMPTIRTRDLAHERRVLAQAVEIKRDAAAAERVAERRKTWRQRITEIFTTKPW